MKEDSSKANSLSEDPVTFGDAVSLLAEVYENIIKHFMRQEWCSFKRANEESLNEYFYFGDKGKVIVEKGSMCFIDVLKYFKPVDIESDNVESSYKINNKIMTKITRDKIIEADKKHFDRMKKLSGSNAVFAVLSEDQEYENILFLAMMNMFLFNKESHVGIEFRVENDHNVVEMNRCLRDSDGNILFRNSEKYSIEMQDGLMFDDLTEKTVLSAFILYDLFTLGRYLGLCSEIYSKPDLISKCDLTQTFVKKNFKLLSGVINMINMD